VRFVLAGDGTDYRKVSDQANRLALPNLRILPAIPKNLTRAFYNNCDACLVPLAPLPIFAGALPTKLFEIMACGRSVIASASGEVPKVLHESGGGWAVAPGDAGALADAVVRLATLAPRERAAMGRKGREYVAQRFHRGALAERYLGLLKLAATRPR